MPGSCSPCRFGLGLPYQRRLLASERDASVHRAHVAALSARLVEVQEEERRAISRELHDGIGQTLAAMLLEDQLPRVRALAEQSLGSVRELAMRLRPSLLDDLGLVPAVEWLARETMRRFGIEVRVTAADAGLDCLPDETKTCAFRVVQEAVTKSARHFGGSEIRISLERRAGQLAVAIEDDGRGFDARQTRGLGLLGMRERVETLGGRFLPQSRPGTGTRIDVHLPTPAGT